MAGTSNTTTKQGVALITGASSGIGAVYADRLARRGYDLILVARDLAKLQTLAERLEKSTGRSVEFIGADLTTLDGRQRVGQVLETDARITLLLNNAGVGATQPLVESDVHRLCKMVQLNVVAVTHLTRMVAPAFVARGRGTIINIASAVALAPEQLNGVYAASKAFVLSLTQSLQHELAAKGVQVQAVLPGATSTDFWGIAGKPVEKLPQQIVMSAEDMVDAALVGLDRGELVTIPSLPDAADWDRFDAARKALAPNLSHAQPAKRYLNN
ncbi:SDR family oxidoreductase [Paucibacter sp. R3-3]|uniref:SDR family oxidoreductase n=1 Tax=Roseateles agri TaxID=3098619 RepID=A0ABU5DCD3_9BURK|nr:SDR family oxidoreductase [Paucibacter sp. R3-3]MDY0743942.1 SDR family oxidoreductase [Paucibacter sp. R3-3]